MARRRWWRSEDEEPFANEGDGVRPEGEALVRLLRDGEVEWIKPIPWGSNYSFAASLKGEARARCIAVYKPRRGEVPLWDFPDGTLFRREYAAYVVSEALGLGFIPPTVVRDGPHGIGTFQLYVDPDESTEYYGFKERHVDELRAIALFDVVANNADRKAGHCLKGADGRIYGIDHGLTFNVVPKLRTVIWEFCGQPLPEELHERLFDFCTDPKRSSELRSQLGEYLHPNEIDAFFVRLERVVERGELPVLDPYRNVPRGFF